MIAVRWHGKIAIVSFDVPPVNALSPALCARLRSTVAELATTNPSSMVLISGGAHFSAGKDIADFGREPRDSSLVDLQNEIERCSFPVVAALDGAAMGAGLDLALTAHFRIATPRAQLAVPEIKLGITGGAQRLLRIVGLAKALDIVLSGRTVSAAEALELGLVDKISDGPLRDAATTFAQEMVAKGAPLRLVRHEDGRLPPVSEAQQTLNDYRGKNAARFRGQIAPEYNIRSLEAGLARRFDEAVREEYRLCEELLPTPQSTAQRYYFAAERKALQIPDVPADLAPRRIKRVGIIGAGTMGSGIAMAFANAGYSIVLVDQSSEVLERGLATIRKNYERTAARGGLALSDIEQRMDRIEAGIELQAVAECDLTIEAVFEQMDIKQRIFRQLSDLCRPGAILATNTSCLDVNEIAFATDRPQDVVGLHFFSPANVMKLVEVVRGQQTAKDVIATAMQLSRQISKTPVLVGVCPGFVGNRILLERQYEAERLIMEGVTPWEVDRVLYDFGFPMGPFAMADLAGLDLGWDEARSSGATAQDRLCEMGRKGQKVGAGYYDYGEDRKATPSPAALQVISDLRAERGESGQRNISDEEILDRCLGLMVNEGAKILAEGKATRASDIDVIWVNGYGWPIYKGGPMYYADRIGLPAFCARLDAMRARYGERFEPAPLLRDLAACGQGFADFDKC
jgi:3-hydroxyacyl-CoA dehydrogenase